MAAASLTLTACGRNDAGSASKETAKDVSSGKATGTITVAEASLDEAEFARFLEAARLLPIAGFLR